MRPTGWMFGIAGWLLLSASWGWGGITVSRRDASELWQLQGAVLYSRAVVEATAEDRAFLITRSFLGKVNPGTRLFFSRCLPIQRIGSVEETLKGFLRLPVVDLPLGPDGTLPVESPESLRQFPPPAPASRFLLFIHLTKDGNWGFSRQTVGEDFFLLQGGRVFWKSWGGGASFWARYDPAPDLRRFLPMVEREVGRRIEFMTAAGIPDKRSRVIRLKPFLDPERHGTPYLLRAIQEIAAAGPAGTALLRREADTPKLRPFVHEILRVLGERRDRGSTGWIRSRCRNAVERLRDASWPFQPSRIDTPKPHGAAWSELFAAAHALARIGDPTAFPELRAAAAWNLAHGTDWWNYLGSDEETVLRFLERDPAPVSRALVEESRALARFGLNPIPTEERQSLIVRFAREHGNLAVPFLLWNWAQQDPEITPLVKTSLIQVVGSDLGDDPRRWWEWYDARLLH